MHNPASPDNQTTTEILNQQASVWMKRGIALLDANTPASVAEAVRCFDQAIGLRRQLPLADHPRLRYGLAAGWMNRGDALTRLAGKDNLAAAIQAFDEALALLRSLPLDEDPLYRRRLIIAWQNRGLTFQTQGDPAALIAAEHSFTEALNALQHEHAAAIVDRQGLAATVWLNHANVLVSQKTEISARTARNAAKQALILALPSERTHLPSALASFKARHVLCQAVAQLLAEKNLDLETRAVLVAEATDTVEAGLVLHREWERQKVDDFRPAAAELLRFGTRVYQAYQPHFLNEFLLEHFDSTQAAAVYAESPEMHAAAMESLWRAFRELQRCGFKTLNTPEFDALLEQLRALRTTEERLAGLREQFLRQVAQNE